MFWNTQIDYEHEFLEIDKSPFSVMAETPLTKVHFLFTMLSLSQLFITRRGVILGVVAKNEFFWSNNKVYQEKKKEEQEQAEEHPDPLGAEVIPSFLSHSIHESIKEEENEDEDLEYQEPTYQPSQFKKNT